MTKKEKIKKKKGGIRSVSRTKLMIDLIRWGRKYPHFWRLLSKSINFKYLFDSLDILFEDVLDYGDEDKVQEWVDLAKDDLSATIKLKGSEQGLALYHLQQCVEKLLKATLIYFGFKTETEIIKYNHKPEKFLIDLIKDNSMKTVLYEKYPFTHIKKPPKVDYEKFDKLEEFIKSNDKTKALDEGDVFVKIVTNLLQKSQPYLVDPDNWKIQMMELYREKLPKKERKRYSSSLETMGTSIDEMFDTIGHSFWVLTSFVLILLPLSIGIWGFESVTRYPDEKRKISKSFDEYESCKNILLIVTHLDRFIQVFEKVISENRELSKLVNILQKK